MKGIFVVLLLCHNAMSLDIYVSEEKGTHSSSCWRGGQDLPCATLGLALEGLSYHNQTTVWVPEGHYNLTEGNDYQFIWSVDIAISIWGTKLNSSVPVTVKCESETGLTFIYVTNITIRGVEFIQCGVYQYSTSRISRDDPFQQFYAGLYFLYVINVTLNFVHVTETPGTGVVMYATAGKITITNSTFSFNSPEGFPDNMSESGGGGLYIEFPYCAPDLFNTMQNCALNSSTHEKYVSNSEYLIESCIFLNNSATIKNETNATFILPHLETHLAFGRGGGLSAFFKGYSNNNLIYIRNCILRNNTALWGGGFFVEYQDDSNSNNFIMEMSVVENNYCLHNQSEEKGTGGGGARIGHIFFDTTHAHHNHMSFTDVFAWNRAYFGGGLSFYTAKEPTEQSSTNTLQFQGCKWISNTARVGSAIDFSQWHPIAYGAIAQPSFTDCEFTNNSAQYTSKLGGYVGKGAFYSDSIPVNFYGQILFESNLKTALVCIGARLSFHSNCTANFSYNAGRDGGAVALMGQSFLEVSSHTTLIFVGNHAELKGGAIFGQSIGEHALISSRNCFIRYSDIETKPLDWESTFYFENNTANKKLNSIYATSLIECLWGGAYGLASISEEAQYVFCWSSNWIYNSSTNCSSEISTSPAKFMVNKDISNNHEDRGHDISISVFPGKRTALPFYTIDDRDENVTDSTILTAKIESPTADAVFTDENAAIDNIPLYISDNSIKLLGTPNKSVRVKLETIAPRVVFTELDITFSICPPGMIHKNNECVCNGNYRNLIDCDQTHYSTNLRRGAWIGISDNTYLAGQCPYCSLFNTNRTTALPINGSNLSAVLCNTINRTGVLCGQCLPEHGLSLYTHECISCPDNAEKYRWIIYILSYILPITLLFMIVIFCNISITSGAVNTFIFFAQMLPEVFDLDGDGTIRQNKTESVINTVYIVVYDIWNLNFFHPVLPEFCFSSKISMQLMLSLGYITAIFPLLLVILLSSIVWAYGKGYRPVVCLCTTLYGCFAKFRQVRVFSGFRLDLPHSILHALATFIVLSYTKFTLVSFILLTEAPLVNNTGATIKKVLYYDGNVDFLGEKHHPYAILAVFVLLTFVALPPIVLILPSLVLLLKKLFKCFFKKEIINGERFCYSQRFQHLSLITDQFLDTFHGCYKDGTDDNDGKQTMNIDCRWFAGFYFILRLLLCANTAFTAFWYEQYFTQQLVCTIALLMIIILRPYKNNLYNIFDALIFANLAILSALSMYNYHATAVGDSLAKWPFVLQYTLIFFPLLLIAFYIVWKKCFCRKKEVDQQDMANIVDADDDDIREGNLDFSQPRVDSEETSLLQEERHYGTVTKTIVSVEQ